MTPENTVYSVLSAYAPLVALVGSHISPHKSLAKEDFPCVTYSVHRGAAVEYTHDGPDGNRDPVFQLDSWAGDFDTARAINAQVLAALAAADDPSIPFNIFIADDGVSIYEPTGALLGGVHRTMALVRIWYQP